jgi:hypothetical protein
MKPGRYNEVIYEEAMQLAAQVYDFKVCQRGDGSYYGTSDSNQCRVGTETAKADKEVSREDRLKEMGIKGKRAATATPALNELSDAEFVRITDAAADIIGIKPTPKVGMMTGGEHDLLVKNEDFLMKAFDDTSKFEEKFRPTSDKEVDAFMAVLNKGQQGKFLPGDVIDRIKNNDPTATDEDMNELRKGLAKRWLQQDGKDLYTGRKINLVEAELEHIRPLTVEGPGRKGADQLKNFGWIDRAVNQSKSNDTMDKFYDKHVRRYTREEQDKRYKESLNRKGNKQALKDQAKVDASRIKGHSDELIKKYGPKGVNYLVEAMGYKRYYRFQGGGERDRGANIWGTYKNSSGKKERLENIVIRKDSTWSASDKKKAAELFGKMGAAIANGTPPAQARQDFGDALQKLGPSS